MRLYFALLLDQGELIEDLGDLRAGQGRGRLEGGLGHTADDLRVNERHDITVGAVSELALGLGLGELVELGRDLAELEAGDGLRAVEVRSNEAELSSLGDGVPAPVGAGGVRSLEIAVADKQELERGSPGQGVVGRIGGGGGAVDDAVIVEVDNILAEPGGFNLRLKNISTDSTTDHCPFAASGAILRSQQKNARWGAKGAHDGKPYCRTDPLLP